MRLNHAEGATAAAGGGGGGGGGSAPAAGDGLEAPGENFVLFFHMLSRWGGRRATVTVRAM